MLHEYSRLWLRDDVLPHQWRKECRTYFESSFGLDYISFALHRFPELDRKTVREGMVGKAQLSTYEDAEREFESSMARIAEVCNCKICSIYETPHSTSSSSRDNPAKESYCLLTLASTIIRLVRELSGIDIINKKLLLSRKGLE